MANWIENKERLGYEKSLSIYNNLALNKDSYRDYLIFNFKTPEKRYLYVNTTGGSFGIDAKASVAEIASFEDKPFLDLTDTEYCITFNSDGAASFFEKIPTTYVL